MNLQEYSVINKKYFSSLAEEAFGLSCPIHSSVINAVMNSEEQSLLADFTRVQNRCYLAMQWI